MYHFNGLTLPDTLHEPIENLPPMLQEWRRCTSPATCLALAAEDESLYRKYIGFYYALVTEIDCHIGRIFEVLKEENLLSNTIVIYAADHGGFVGGHGMYEKCAYGHNVYEDTLRIPLIFYSKDFQKGNVCNDLVELTDIYPTLLELAEIDEPGCKMEGCSLVPTLTKGQAIKRAYAISENWFQLTVITKRYKYGQWIKVPEDVVKNKKAIKDYRSFGNMLFDLETDPLETNNLAGNPKFINVEETLKGYISEWISKVNCEGKDDFVKSLSKEV
jgi:arylsulfatase A-like enzyme